VAQVIGKERILLEVAARTGLRLCVTETKMEVLRRVGLTLEQLQVGGWGRGG
jgi:hypothetical protein